MVQKFDDSGRALRQVIPDQTSAVLDEPLDAWQARGLSAAEDSSLAAALATSLAAAALLACEDIDQVFKTATELARDFIGLERVALYVCEPGPGRVLLRGTWGTGAHGETTDEHGLAHELSPQDARALQNLRATGACGLYQPRASWSAVAGDRTVPLGEGWAMLTPLISGNDLFGVLYNDAACSRSAVDTSKQAAAAVLANVVSMEYASRCGPVQWGPPRVWTEPSRLVQRIRNAVDRNVARRGSELASQFGVSPGHLARVFKREMGISLVDYRNRKRLDRFFEVVQRSGGVDSLKQAVVEAGFGSYAQFSRIHKKFVPGGPPGEVLRSGPLEPVKAALHPGSGRATR